MTLAAEWRALGPRSLLFVPADRAKELLPKAMASGADGVIIDLEDAVAPAAKPAARDTCRAAVLVSRVGVPVFVRINSLATEWGHADLAALAGAPIAGIMVPRVERVDDVETVAHLMGTDDRVLIPLLETAAGILAAAAVAAADPRVIGVALGLEDLGAQLGLRRSRHGHELLFARSQVVVAAVAAGCWALDSPCIEPRGVGATRREALRARALGYTGKLLIHPAQVAPAHEAFTPTPDEVASARRVLASFEEMARAGIGVDTAGGRMIDRAMVVAAQHVLARANQDGQRGDVPA